MALLGDWLAYIKDPELFDQHHFESLGLELQTADSLNAAFSSLPGGAGLVQRILDIRRQADFNGTYLLANRRTIDAEAYSQAELYKDGVADRQWCGMTGPDLDAQTRSMKSAIFH